MIELVHRKREVLRFLGTRVRRRRVDRGLTQRDLAVCLGMSSEYVSLIERGRRDPAYTTVVGIARCLRLPASELMPG